MSQYKEGLSDGGQLIVSRDDWFIRYVEWPRLTVDGRPDLRFNPSPHELSRSSIIALVGELTAPWAAAQSAFEIVRRRGSVDGTVEFTLPGGYKAEVRGGEVRIFFPALGYLDQSAAERWSKHYAKVILRADEQQELLASLDQLHRSNPQEIAKWEGRLADLLGECSTRRSAWKVLVTLKGRDKALVAGELTGMGSTYKQIEAIHDSPSVDTVELTVAAPSQWDAERYASLLLTLWESKTSLQASASR